MQTSRSFLICYPLLKGLEFSPCLPTSFGTRTRYAFMPFYYHREVPFNGYRTRDRFSGSWVYTYFSLRCLIVLLKPLNMPNLFPNLDGYPGNQLEADLKSQAINTYPLFYRIFYYYINL